MDLQKVKLVIFDFDGVFTDNSVYISQNGIESVKCHRSDGLGISRLRSLKIPTYIISTESNIVVSVRAQKLKIPVFQNIKDKSETVKLLCKDLSIKLENTMFVGNDINDIPALKICGFPFAVKDCYDEIKPYVKFITENNGGEGAVREICDLIFFQKKNE
jgi:3-deoxy-D-manno-octulosonate 8-phosphate phosphatase (KDO 8-P phosphatase)